jgi:hypothetical protein
MIPMHFYQLKNIKKMPLTISKAGLIFLVIFFFSVGLRAQKVTVKSKANPVEQKIDVRSFDQSALSEYRAQKEFRYTDTVSLKASLWNRFWMWFWQQFGNLFFNSTSGTIFKYLGITVGICVVLFVIVKLSGMDLMQIITGKSPGVDVPYSETLENIHEIDFDQNIEDAVNSKNYRLAVRLLYLKSLKRLSDSGMIDWQINKTNSVYVNELNHPAKKTVFLKLTHQFEYIWYGEYFLERPGYQHIESSFKEFMKKI